jgi:integrase
VAVKVRERNGAWWIFIDHGGQRKAKRVGTGRAGRKAAEAAAMQIAAKLASGDVGVLDSAPRRVTTFSDFATDWLTTDVALRLKPATQENYRVAMERHWLPVLGALPLAAVSRERIRAVMAEKRTPANPAEIEPLKVSTLKTLLIPLRACLNAAVDAGLIPSNPALRLGRVFRPDDEEARTIDPFTPGELTTLLQLAEAQMPEHYPLLLTLARTGMRIGEALAMRKDDLDFSQRAVWVRRTWGRRAMGTPKSGKARRVDMSQQLMRTLQGCLSVREAEAVVSGQADPSWLFLEPGTPEPMRPMWFYRHVWWPLLGRSGLRYRNTHALRHTYASLLIQNGESLPYVRDQLGHGSIKITVDTYGHLVPGANRQAVDRLDDTTGRNLYATSSSAPGSDSLEDRELTSDREYLRTKWSTRRGMSSLRERSGGTESGTTLSR